MTLRAQMRQLTGQSAVYGMAGALSKLVALVVVPILGHIFSNQDYGVIEQITAFSSLVGAFLILGSDAAIGFYYYREADDEGRHRLLSTWLIFQISMNCVVGAAIFAFAHPLTLLLLGRDAHNDSYLQIVAAVLPLSTTITFVLEVLRLQMRPAGYLLISAVSVLSGLALTLVLVVALRLGLLGVYIGSATTNVISFVMAMVLIRGSVRPAFSARRLRALLAYGVPLVPITIASWAITLSNRFFIQAHTGGSDVGIFAMGNKIAQIMFLFVTAFTLAWGPFAFSIAAERDARRTYAKVLTFYVAVMGWIALALSLFAPLILQLAVKPSYARAYQVVPPLALAYMVGGAYTIVAMGTSLSKRTIHLSWTTITAAAVTVLLNAILLPLPYMSLIGGALATLAGQLVSVGLVYWTSQRLYPIPFERGKVLTCVVLLGALVAGGQLWRAWAEPGTVLGSSVRLALVALYPLLLLGFRVIERYEAVVLREAVRARLHRAP